MCIIKKPSRGCVGSVGANFKLHFTTVSKPPPHDTPDFGQISACQYVLLTAKPIGTVGEKQQVITLSLLSHICTQVSFEKRVSGEGEEGEEEEEEVVKVVKKTLFQRSNAYPQKKVLTFNRYSKDFPFSVYYSHLGFLSHDEKTCVSLPTVWLCIQCIYLHLLQICGQTQPE